MSNKKKNASQEETPKEEVLNGEVLDAEETAEAIETESEVNPLAAELAAEHDRYLRMLAEYDNFRKRSQKDRESIYSDVRADTVSRFLPVYDNLLRAVQQATNDEAYLRGVEMILGQMKEIMAKLGVTEIEAVGKPFNPDLHNAVMHIEDENYGEGEIIQEFEKGFLLGDKVIRFSMVQVAN